MRRIVPVFLIIVVLCYFSSCEKDDICVEGDTPLLIIGFFDVNDTTLAKTVPSLRIVETSENIVVNTFTDRSSSLDSISIPLRITADATEFMFITDSADDDENNETGTIDTLTFDYTVNENFISRACGFVANFNGLDTTRTVYSTDWIKGISIQETDIEISNAIHVKIFH
ncbi:DUF6452 family protein [Flagellimonas sp. DF-77]|uniref:DUF6452 family protein n=1 Tax=Flagellimonas algarum TaxID=3230298 RepID=UPI003396CF95